MTTNEHIFTIEKNLSTIFQVQNELYPYTGDFRKKNDTSRKEKSESKSWVK